MVKVLIKYWSVLFVMVSGMETAVNAGDELFRTTQLLSCTPIALNRVASSRIVCDTVKVFMLGSLGL